MSKTARNVLVAIGVILIVVIVAGVAAFYFISRNFVTGYRFIGPGIMRSFAFFPFGGGLMSFVIAVLIVLGIVWLIASLAQGPDTSSRGITVNETPLDILKRRYAKGEITKEQFEEMKRDISV